MKPDTTLPPQAAQVEPARKALALKESKAADSAPDRFCGVEETCSIAGGVCKMTLRRWEAAGKFPKRVRLAHNLVAWRWSELKAWIDRQCDERDGKAA